MTIVERVRKKILYAEDELVTAKYIMKKMGSSFEFFHAENGVEAWKKFQNEKSFDICLFDLFMPEMDGVELIKLIRSIDYKVPIVVISGGRKSKLEEAMEAGANASLKKPDDIEYIVKIFDEFS